jgi:predicted ATPase/Tfp pilus assembly protein PilF
VVSAVTAEILREAPPPGLGLRDLGEYQLKDLPTPEHVWQLLHPELPADFPALASTRSRRHNLPVQLSSLVGRNNAVAELRRLIPRARLLTLTGPGGIGKTRLALALAEAVLPDYADGVWLVDLSSLLDHTLVTQAVAAALGVRDEPCCNLRDTLVASVQHRRLLVLIDNCEHLVQECAELAEALLRACNGLSILATAREPLRASGETTWRVPPLALPEPLDGHPLEEIELSDAGRLFVERAQAALPQFVLTEQNARAVTEVCHRLDGIPLALELAAARVPQLGVAEIARRLDDHLRLLVGGARTAPARHQTLRATMEWSHELLTESERRVFERLAIFAGGWTLDAAESVCSDEDVHADSVLDLLGQLVDRSLAVADAATDGTLRYRLLETLRQYAHEQLASSGALQSTASRHAAYYVALGEQAAPRLTGMDQGVWLKRLEQEQENLRAALRWTIDAGQPGLGLRLACAVWRFWLIVGHLSEGRRWLEQLLLIAPGVEVTPAAVAEAVNAAGSLAVEQGDLDRGTTLLEEGLARSRAIGNRQGIVLSLASLGAVARERGDYSRASTLLEDALTLARDIGDTRGMAASLRALAGLAWEGEGDYAVATARWEEARALARDMGDQLGIGLSLNGLAWIAKDQGDHLRATARWDEALVLFRSVGATSATAWALTNLGVVARDTGDYGRAIALLEEALALLRGLGERRGIAWAVTLLGIIARDQGAYGRASALLQEALALARDRDSKHEIARSLGNLGIVARNQGQFGDATDRMAEALALSRAVGDRWGIAWVLYNLAGLAVDRGDHRQAATLLDEGLTLSRALGDKRALAWSLHVLGRVAASKGDCRQAEQLLIEGLTLFHELGDREGMVAGVEELAAVACAQDQPDPAVRLLASAQTAREALGTPRPPADRGWYEHTIFAARTGLGDSAFSATWNEGHALTLQQAIATAHQSVWSTG